MLYFKPKNHLLYFKPKKSLYSSKFKVKKKVNSPFLIHIKPGSIRGKIIAQLTTHSITEHDFMRSWYKQYKGKERVKRIHMAMPRSTAFKLQKSSSAHILIRFR